MRPFADAAAQSVQQHDTFAETEHFVPQEPPAIWLRRLWERMTALYGHAWTNVHGLSPQARDQDGLTMSGSTWAGALAGLTGKQIGEGVKACIATGGEFPPNAPRFRALCLNIPSLEAVRAELQGGEPSQFTRAVWVKLDMYRFRQASFEQADKLLAGTYRLVRDAVMQGEPLPVAPAAVIVHEARTATPATPEQCAAHIARIRDLLVGSAT